MLCHQAPVCLERRDLRNHKQVGLTYRVYRGTESMLVLLATSAAQQSDGFGGSLSTTLGRLLESHLGQQEHLSSFHRERWKVKLM